jgi:putative oxidoreductase
LNRNPDLEQKRMYKSERNQHPISLVIARVLLSGIFLKAGINHALDFMGMQQTIIAKGIPAFLATGMALGGIILLLAGGLSILLGYKVRVGAKLLILFLIPATLLFHLNFADQMQQIQFLKNLGLMGGLLLLIQTGAGYWSLDRSGDRRG